eukprot:COSAG04_NODE_18325_length_445_cov_1.026012_1_plen_37_part_10
MCKVGSEFFLFWKQKDRFLARGYSGGGAEEEEEEQEE